MPSTQYHTRALDSNPKHLLQHLKDTQHHPEAPHLNHPQRKPRRRTKTQSKGKPTTQSNKITKYFLCKEKDGSSNGAPPRTTHGTPPGSTGVTNERETPPLIQHQPQTRPQEPLEEANPPQLRGLDDMDPKDNKSLEEEMMDHSDFELFANNIDKDSISKVLCYK